MSTPSQAPSPTTVAAWASQPAKADVPALLELTKALQQLNRVVPKLFLGQRGGNAPRCGQDSIVAVDEASQVAERQCQG